MQYEWKLISSLEKVFPSDAMPKAQTEGSMLKNEIYSFQLVGIFQNYENFEAYFDLTIDSALSDCISVYQVGYVPSTFPALTDNFADDDYITKAPGLFPDPLYKIRDGRLRLIPGQLRSFWFAVEPEGKIPAGTYPIRIKLDDREHNWHCELTFMLEIIDAALPKQDLLCTGWFHGDCLSVLHNTEMQSDDYFALTEKYLKIYKKFGHNMILTPVFTPPLDTDIGGERPTNQLVDVTVTDGTYSFDFTNLKRWIGLCKSCGIEYFEISHLFTQWGAYHAPKIMATVNGSYQKIFGWETDSLSPEYHAFLDAFLPKLKEFLTAEGVYVNCLFHVSDEPHADHREQYEKVRKALLCHIEEDRLFDALSDFSFYENGLIHRPVVPVDVINPFVEHAVKPLWAYYCCCQGKKVANRFMAMPSYRNRVLGYQLYKHDIEGFLQWGFNFWFSGKSRYVIDPFADTSSGDCFPSGDAFVVYPLDKQGDVTVSLRLYVFHDALQDLRALKLLESYIGKDAVMAMLTDIQGFEEYPRDNDALLLLRETINQKIKENL